MGSCGVTEQRSVTQEIERTKYKVRNGERIDTKQFRTGERANAGGWIWIKCEGGIDNAHSAIHDLDPPLFKDH